MSIGIAGFLLSHRFSIHPRKARYFDGIFDGISWGWFVPIRPWQIRLITKEFEK